MQFEIWNLKSGIRDAVRALLCLALLIAPSAAFAFETDQFNLPEQPLADIGAEVSDYVEEKVGEAMAEINAEITKRQNCLDNEAAKNCDSEAANRERLKYLRSPAALERKVFNKLGSGIPPFTASGSWMESHKFKVEPARYKTNRKESIYAAFPSNYFTISETVNLFGNQFGTDKIAHIFQQGFTYLRIYQRALEKNLSEQAATKRANDWGRRSERTFYGNLVSGVYSNADLAANFAGLRFYQNLTGAIKTGAETKLPLVRLDAGVWRFNERVDLKENLLKPFITAHLNEAINSSIYTNFFGLRSSVRAHVKNRACAEWKRDFPNLAKVDFERMSNETKLWHGDDYGFTANKNFITIADTCFDD